MSHKTSIMNPKDNFKKYFFKRIDREAELIQDYLRSFEVSDDLPVTNKKIMNDIVRSMIHNQENIISRALRSTVNKFGTVIRLDEIESLIKDGYYYLSETNLHILTKALSRRIEDDHENLLNIIMGDFN